MSGHMGCEAAREAIHRRLDRAQARADERQDLEFHLASCAACREVESDLREIQRALLSLPAVPLPDDALHEVWIRTSRAPSTGRDRGAFDWRALAAAALLVAALVGLSRRTAPPVGPSTAELRRAAEETRVVLRLTARALDSTGRIAIKDVLEGEVSAALRRVPIDWPEAKPARANKHDARSRT